MEYGEQSGFRSTRHRWWRLIPGDGMKEGEQSNRLVVPTYHNKNKYTAVAVGALTEKEEEEEKEEEKFVLWNRRRPAELSHRAFIGRLIVSPPPRLYKSQSSSYMASPVSSRLTKITEEQYGRVYRKYPGQTIQLIPDKRSRLERSREDEEELQDRPPQHSFLVEMENK
ncbi:hypothetical protein DAPPUDRAFT_234018 [Daphnia pulex]|uniref:Uncharacterized protein n=1 Tax=Daphnia pulex TaxID=6669 RepID=E9FUD1_DAPPU|nr:hypothetical protein DAPPUDRAFT_234018 [Daphnia pulex]|eukprot:EFX88704.1 hypothetical protein DAPPUDRAFT_234018 [Daphnia pulex]